MFTQLYKLSFLLVVIATITVGAPLGNVITTPIFKRDEILDIMTPIHERAEIDTTFPVCANNNHKYKASLCYSLSRMMVFCEDPNNPTLEIINYVDCEEADEACIEHYHAVSNDSETPHATCVNPSDITIRSWNNFDNPGADACSETKPYEHKGPHEFAMIIYAHDNKPIQVNYLEAYSDGKLLSSINGQHNYTYITQNYNQEDIKYCFNTGTNAKVTAFAAGWIIDQR